MQRLFAQASLNIFLVGDGFGSRMDRLNVGPRIHPVRDEVGVMFADHGADPTLVSLAAEKRLRGHADRYRTQA